MSKNNKEQDEKTETITPIPIFNPSRPPSVDRLLGHPEAQALIEAQLERMRSPRAGGPGAARSDEDSAPATDRPATAADGDPDVESIPIE